MKRMMAIWVTLALMAMGTVGAQERGIKILADDWQGLQVEYSTPLPTVGEVTLGGQSFSTLHIEGCQPSPTIGAPMLPTWSMLIEVPLCDGFDIKVEAAEYDTLPTLRHPLMPVQPSRSKSDTSAAKVVVLTEAYEGDAFGGVLPEVEVAGIARDRRVARVQYSPVQYNPVTGVVVVCRRARLSIAYRNADMEGTLALFHRHHTPAFSSGLGVVNSLYPKSARSTAPVRYLIVAHSMFRGHLDTFAAWKRRKGMITDIVYTDDAGVGSDTASIAAYIRSQYTNATDSLPSPTYLLIVGDVQQIPAFEDRVSYPEDCDHITDLYYTTWTAGDNLPDCYYGRFSAQNVTQLQAQINKTLMHEQYTFADPSFLDRAVMIAGVDRGEADDYAYRYADPAMDYAIINYINGASGFSQVRYFKNDTTIIPTGVSNVILSGNSSSMSATVRSFINQGAGWVNYSAHGSSTSWGTPNITTSHVNSMTNSQKFGLMIGNCCLTNKFEVGTCFGEALLRKGNYCGAVGYIGGSNSTYWSEDFYWAVGLRGSVSPTMPMNYNASHLGAYDRMEHTHGESHSQWAPTQGSLVWAGNMAVQSSTSSLKHYYWEIYHLMGDPSLMPYLTQADTMEVVADSIVVYGSGTLSVSAVPHAYIALTDSVGQRPIAAAFADDYGIATLILPPTLPIGNYELVAWAQQYRVAFRTVQVTVPSGAFPMVSDMGANTLLAGDTVAIPVTLSNPGSITALGIDILLSSDSPYITLPNDTLHIDSLAAGAQVVVGTVDIVVPDTTPDLCVVSLLSHCSWTNDGGGTAANRFYKNVLAPVVKVDFAPVHPTLHPGGSDTLTATVSNHGHASLPSGRLVLSSPTGLVEVSPVTTDSCSLAPDEELELQFVIQADSQLPSEITLPIAVGLSGTLDVLHDTLELYIGDSYTENFEGGLHLSGWTVGRLSWTVIDTVAYEGQYCLRSKANMEHNSTSTMQLTVHIGEAGVVTFYYRVSSESGYDKFHFHIGDSVMLTKSGEVDWESASFPIDTGTVTFQFLYAKDYSVSRGSDCAFIDNLTLPHRSRVLSCEHIDVCEGQELVVAGDSIDTHQPTAGSLAEEDSDGTVHLIDYTVHPVYSTTDSVTATGSYLWEGTEYSESGIYTIDYTTVMGCDSTLTLVLTIIEDTTAISPIDLWEKLTVAPNPTHGVVSLGQEANIVSVYDATGRLLLRRRDTHSVDLSSLPAGVYTLHIELPVGVVVGKVIKN